jgi:sugar phosphate isomerase/epimerase
MKLSVADGGNIEAILPVVWKYGVGVEVQEYLSPNNLDDHPEMASEIAEKIKSIPLRGFHGPFSELVPASRDKKIQEVTRSRFQSAYELAQVVRAQHIILHAGYIPKTYPRETWLANSVAFWVDFLADKGNEPQLHLENVYEDDFTLLVELLDRINEKMGEEMVTTCLDIGHVHANSSKPFTEWIAGLGKRIKYAHLHNNDGILDDHWGLWKGKIDMPRVLDLLLEHAPDAVWMIEASQPDIEPSIIWLEEKGYYAS